MKGIKQNPFNMRTSEKVMFGALMTSIGIGCFQLLTSPWKIDNQDSKNDNNTSTTFTKGSMNNKQHNSHDIIMNSGEKQQSQVKEKSWTHM
eukprot:CAMPEP_0178964288 /NCGR_PEP_ID=MMETSP0789-20121207/15583_1 /TAXON_ID=3005 /ORGANISM="Rhizosolenia setigera, Strain CCMP 1694" /LENGTH=90 /DNA_ID=CAMNT_0020649025 /DNA_START=97 /DNA_END=369 /DNA_ORIENTATION=+